MDHARLRSTVKAFKRGMLHAKDFYHLCVSYGMTYRSAEMFVIRMTKVS